MEVMKDEAAIWWKSIAYGNLNNSLSFDLKTDLFAPFLRVLYRLEKHFLICIFILQINKSIYTR